MEKIKINHLLFTSLLNTDFFFLKNNFLLKNFNLFNLLKLHKKAFLHLLNPLDIIIHLKQFIRVTQFFKKQKTPVLNFFVQEIHQEAIINNFIHLNEVNIKCKVFFKFLVLKKKASQFLVFLKDFLCKDQKISQTVLNKKSYLVQEITANTGQNNLGSYKMYNKIFDYKKLILLLILIRQVWKKSTIKKVKTTFTS